MSHVWYYKLRNCPHQQLVMTSDKEPKYAICMECTKKIYIRKKKYREVSNE